MPTNPQSTGSSLQQAVQRALASDGPLAEIIEGFCARPQQMHMAQAISQLIQQPGALVLEAPTGIGKTFAYLVPALLAGERVIISTATKALQEQLFERDLPRLTQALGLPLRRALLKGRSNYLCLHRLQMAEQMQADLPPQVQQDLHTVLRWAKQTQSGDMAELNHLDENAPIRALTTSTRENCLGADCPFYQSCHVNRARRQALAADVVVINHHLFFADLAVRQSGVAQLLPLTPIVIFDEAHQLNEIGIQFLGQSLTTSQLTGLARDIQTAGLIHARGVLDWTAIAADIQHMTQDLRLVAGHAHKQQRLRWTQATPEGLDAVRWQQALQSVHQVLTDTHAALECVHEMAPDFKRLRERVTELDQQVQGFMQTCISDDVRWLEVSRGLRLTQAPLDIAKVMQAQVQTPLEAEAPQQAEHASQVPARSWVFVSATLGADEQLSWFTQACGLQHARTLKLDSPFDYSAQAALYIPSHLSAPGQSEHALQVAQFAARAAQDLGGRTMVLTTSLVALRRIGSTLKQHFSQAPDALDVLVQGSMSKSMLLQKFRQAPQKPARGAILVASASFWEGVDIPGDALQLVVIDKLPFPSPGEPLVEARCRRLQAQGGNAFRDYFLPSASVSLKQGAGRLIRAENDRGLLVICDRRLLEKSYGKRLLRALPPMRRLADAQAFEAALKQLVASAATSCAPALTTAATKPFSWRQSHVQ